MLYSVIATKNGGKPERNKPMLNAELPGHLPASILHNVIRDTPNGVLFFDAEFRVSFANQSAVELLEMPQPLPENLDIRTFAGALNLKELNLGPSETRTMRRKKDLLHYKIIALNDTGEGFGYAMIFMESEETLHSRSELELAWKLTGEMEEILEGSFDGILVTDGEGNVQFVNSSYERVAAIPKKELVGRNMRALINPVWMENSVAFVVMEERRPVSKRQITKDGRDIIVTGKPVFDEAGKIRRIVINARDITEIFQLREELLNAKNRELQHYSSMMCTKNIESEKFVAVSENIKRVFSLAERVGPFDTTVLILGESGAGKEEVARQIHCHSLRRDHALVTINCGAIPENLLESELFGYEKGAFTGASTTGKIGLLEAADGGTVFLDEIGEIPLSVQVKLLRVLETKQVTRVGGIKPKSIDVRFIAATNRDLAKMTHAGTFREDFYYRLNVVSITVPPLRQRREDILPLSLFFLNLFNRKYNQKKTLSPEVVKRLEENEWEGNVRELRNVVESMVIMSPNEQLQISDVPWIRNQCTGLPASDRRGEDRAQAEREEETTDLTQAIQDTEIRLLRRAKKQYATTREIARYLNVDQSTVVRKLRKYEL